MFCSLFAINKEETGEENTYRLRDYNCIQKYDTPKIDRVSTERTKESPNEISCLLFAFNKDKTEGENNCREDNCDECSSYVTDIRMT